MWGNGTPRSGTEARLWSYLKTVDRERFFRAAALVGAFLVGSGGGSYFLLRGRPWFDGAASSGYAQSLASLIGELDDSHAPPDAPVVPVVAALGLWVHGRCSEASPRPEDERLLYALPGFLSAHQDELVHCLQAFSCGRVYFQPNPGQDWPDRGADAQFSHALTGVRQRATELATRLRLSEQLKGFSLNAYLARAQAATAFLCRGQPFANLSWLAVELKQYVAKHPSLSPEHVATLADSIIGAPTVPGPTYTRMLTAALWVLSEWGGDSTPLHLAVHLGHCLLFAL